MIEYPRSKARSSRSRVPLKCPTDDVMTTRAGARADQPLLEQLGEQEPGQVVDRERRLEPVVGDGAPGEHRAGVVDEHVDPFQPLQQVARQRPYGVQRGEVRGERLHAGRARGPHRLGRVGQAHLVAADEHQVVPVGPELEC